MRRVSFVGVVIALSALAAISIARAAGAPTLVSAASPYTACTAGLGTGTTYVNAEVEPYVAISPKNPSVIVGAWQQDRASNGGANGLVAGYSSDGGATWNETPLPFDSCAGGPVYERASDPWVSIGPDGIVYANAISFDRLDNRNGVFSAVSKDGGKTWGNVVGLQVYETNGGQFSTDKNSVTADPNRNRTAYAVWDTLVLATDNPDDNPRTSAYTGPGYFSKTTDGGKTWSAPQVIFPTSQNNQTIGNQIVVAPDGTIYDFTDWIVHPNSVVNTNANVAFVKSTDGGTTWSAPQKIAQIKTAGVVDPNTGATIRTGDIIPEPAVDPVSGALYVVWQDSRFNGGHYDEVAISRSTDGGTTWSAPARVSSPTGRPAFTPMVRVNAAGAVAVTYYDFRNLTSETTTLPTDYWITFSNDGGRTFGGEQHISGPWDMLTAPYAVGYFVGDYEGLAASGTTFRPFWVQANSGNTANRTDVFTTTFAP